MTAITETGQDEYVVDNSRLRAFITEVTRIKSDRNQPREILAAIRPHFVDLLADKTWLPARYQEPAADGGMGSGIGRGSSIVPATAASRSRRWSFRPARRPVHDHLAWGLVGLYRGTQDEDVFLRTDDGSSEDEATLTIAESRALVPGDLYELLPETDIHRVRTTSPETSVSLHLLGIDNGCIWRHRFLPEEGKVLPFKSGYVNMPCDEEGDGVTG